MAGTMVSAEGPGAPVSYACRPRAQGFNWYFGNRRNDRCSLQLLSTAAATANCDGPAPFKASHLHLHLSSLPTLSNSPYSPCSDQHLYNDYPDSILSSGGGLQYLLSSLIPLPLHFRPTDPLSCVYLWLRLTTSAFLLDGLALDPTNDLSNLLN